MQEWFKNHYNDRQRWAFSRISEVWRNVGNGAKGILYGIVSALVITAELFGMIVFDIPVTPRGQQLDLTGYSLVFEDEFLGDSLDTERWAYRASGARRGGFNAESQVEVADGKLTMTAEYLEDGEYGAGWYAGMIRIIEEYKYGYFEIKCICNPGGGFWSAFWLQAQAPYTPEISKGGIGGAEIDIFEAFYNESRFTRNCVAQNIHCSGREGDTSGNLNSSHVGDFRGNDIFNEYNTYGLEWTPEEYIFYINGVESARSSFADGASQVMEYVVVSLEIPEEIAHDKDFQSQFIIDYVKIWQKVD